MIDLNEVRMFVQVVRANSFAEAARRLGVPPNTLSRRVRQLEASLDTRLMQRSTRKLTLTTAGQIFFDRCAQAVDEVSTAGKELADDSHHPSGAVRVAAPADFLDLFRLDWIAEFFERYPLIRLEFVLSDAFADLIEEGIDVAFRGGSSVDARSAVRQISSQYFQLMASPDYLKRRGTPRTLQELAQHDCLTASTQKSRSTWTLIGPEGAEEVRVSGRLGANSARVLARSCVAGLGIGLLPAMLAAADLDAGRLVHVLPQYRREGASLNVILPSREHVPAAVIAFVDFATQRLRTLASPR